MTSAAECVASASAIERSEETFVPHLGWLVHEEGEDVARSLGEGWFEYREQAFFWLYLRPGATVFDCGAHVGLFSVLAGRLIGAPGRLVCIEPHPETAKFLERNLAAHGITSAHVVRSAVGDRAGTAKLHLGASGRAAYSSLLPLEEGSDQVEAPVVTLGQLAETENVQGQIDLLKLDVEGFEIEALAGARGLLTSGRIRILLVEFTERNLNASGRSTVDLRDALAAAGYDLYRLDDADLALRPATITAPIDYDNFFALRDSPEPINALLAAAPPDRRRIAREIAKRGRAANDARVARARLRRQVTQLTAEVGQHKIAIRDLKARLRDAREEHRRMVGSRTWRYTRPLRALGGLMAARRRRR